MSAIAHFLEDEGIATTVIALIRLHAEKVRPPRAVWVTFQLGRPLGEPGNAEFQRGVLEAALKLLNSGPPGPLLTDFPLDEPNSANVAEWMVPPAYRADSLADEVAVLKPLYERSLHESGRTTVGISGSSIDEIVAYLAAFDSAQPLAKLRNDLSDVQCMRYAVDDLKAFYLEAIVVGAAPASAWQFANWFWEETAAGELIKNLRRNSLEHSDKNRRYASWWLVPDGWSDGKTVAQMRKIDVTEDS